MLDAFFLNVDPETYLDENEHPEVNIEMRILLRYMRQSKTHETKT